MSKIDKYKIKIWNVLRASKISLINILLNNKAATRKRKNLKRRNN